MIQLVKDLWWRFLLWRATRKVDRDLDKIFDTSINGGSAEYKEDHNQRQIYEGVRMIKSGIARNGYSSAFMKGRDLLDLAKSEKNDTVELMKGVIVASKQDVKTEDDKVKMIDKRINHYYELQKYNEEKALIREIKKAKKIGDISTHDKLMNEWREKYERNSNYNN